MGERFFDLLGDPIPEGRGEPGRPEHIPTSQNINRVRTLLLAGMQKAAIARELGARIDAQLAMARLRRHVQFTTARVERLAYVYGVLRFAVPIWWWLSRMLWAGTVVIHPKAKTGAHHHGHLESVIYIVRGRARMRWGEQLEFTAEAGPGVERRTRQPQHRHREERQHHGDQHVEADPAHHPPRRHARLRSSRRYTSATTRFPSSSSNDIADAYPSCPLSSACR